MSNIFINRNRSQGAYKSEILKQKFQTTEENWNNRVGLARTGKDSFYKNSLRYHANPDLSPKHVGMGWSIVDACDAIKPNAGQMKEKYRVTETSMPLAKAYNQYENPNLTYEDRMAQYQGPQQPERNTGRMSNGFTQYQHSGGISKQDVKNQINDIATKIISAKEMKGTLMLNNGKPNGTSWKTPAMDLALNAQNGGETGQRFYQKFPIYRPRGDAPPDVKDDIQAIWDNQISLQNKDESKPRAAMDSFYKSFSTKNADGFQGAFKDTESGVHRRSGSRGGKTLKFAGKNTLFPQRHRFNEDANSVISENKQKMAAPALRAQNLPGAFNGGAADARSQSQKSKQTLNPSELQKYFSEKKAKIAEDAQSRQSEAMSYKSRASNAIALAKMISENSKRDAEAGDAITVATSAVDALSIAPSIVPSQAATDVLQDEYKKLLDEYEHIAEENQQMENEVAELKARELAQ